MNLKDATTVLGKCSAFDNRQPTQATALAWSEALADMPVQDALNFVSAHYATSREWIMPSDLNRAWEQLRKARQQAVPQDARPLPPQDATPEEYLAFRRAASKAISHGRTLEEVRAAAWAAINRTPPPPEITTNHEINYEQIGQRA